MSASSVPINPTAFAEALTSLPLASLYAKGAEIQNSISHLERSNNELQHFIQETPGGDKDFEDAVGENEVVIERMKERIELLKVEIEGRGQSWSVEGIVGEAGREGEGREGQGGEGDVEMGESAGMNGSAETSEGGGNTVSEGSRTEPQGNRAGGSPERGVYL